jgi:hypothetical protein
MDIPLILDMQIQNTDPGTIADALINYLDANWSVYTCAQRDELISEAEMFHAAAVEQYFD